MSRSPEALERNRVASREAKRRRRGVCVDCGAETRYAGKNGNAISMRCQACGPKYHARMHLEGHGSVVERLYALLATRPHRFSEIRDALGLSNEHTSMRLRRSIALGRIVRVRYGVYELAPTHNTREQAGVTGLAVGYARRAPWLCRHEFVQFVNRAKPEPCLIRFHCECGQNWGCPVCGWGAGAMPCRCARDRMAHNTGTEPRE